MPITKFPILYHKAKTGAIHSWEVYAEDDGFVVTAGTLNGKKIVSPQKVEQKNIGKANETSLEDQAIKEAQALWTKKLEKKYSETIEGTEEEVISAMAAHPYDDKTKKTLEFPVDVQRKFNGVRCLAFWENGKIKLLSRGLKEWKAVPHINEAVAKLLPADSVFDGELYIHGLTLQAINRLVKKARPESVNIEYHVYDMPIINNNRTYNWDYRKSALDCILAGRYGSSKVVYVEYYSAANDEDVKLYHDSFVRDGYEGAMIRNRKGLYLFGYRSKELLKLKEFEDHEYKVSGYKNGVGRYEDCVVWKCLTPEGLEFEVNHAIKLDEKREYLKKADSYIGKSLTVRHRGYTEAKIPNHPVGITFRLEEDLPDAD